MTFRKVYMFKKIGFVLESATTNTTDSCQDLALKPWQKRGRHRLKANNYFLEKSIMVKMSKCSTSGPAAPCTQPDQSVQTILVEPELISQTYIHEHTVSVNSSNTP